VVTAYCVGDGVPLPLQGDTEPRGVHAAGVGCSVGGGEESGSQVLEGRGARFGGVLGAVRLPQGHSQGSHVLLHRDHGLRRRHCHQM
jgi:hypothetical protein